MNVLINWMGEAIHNIFVYLVITFHILYNFYLSVVSQNINFDITLLSSQIAKDD